MIEGAPQRRFIAHADGLVPFVDDLASAVASAGMLIVAVRPGSVPELLSQIAACETRPQLCVSLAAGVPLQDSIARAKKFVTASMANYLRWKSNTGGNIDALNHRPDNAIED